MSEIRVHMST